MADFKDIIGNERIITNIKNSIIHGSISHAYIISGARGSGKRLIADAFAKALLCQRAEGEPCGECQSCHMFESGNNPDIFYAVPQKTKTLGVDDIRRQVIKNSEIKQYMFKYKVFIIEEADKMTVQAQNALLKTLEEPPAYAVFILLCENSELMLPTVVSRCVIMRTEAVSRKSIYDYLIRKGVDEPKAALACEYSRGSIGEALTLTEDEAFMSMRDDVIKILAGIYGKSKAEAIAIGLYIKNTYKDSPRLMDVISLWYRDVLTAKTTNSDKYIIQKDKTDEIFYAADNETAESLIEKHEIVKKTAYSLKRNANFQLAMEVMFMNIKESI